MEFSLFPIGFSLFFIVLLLFLVMLLSNAVYLVRQAEVILIERLGRFDRMLSAGIHFVWPFVEKPRTVIWALLKSGMAQWNMYIYG